MEAYTKFTAARFGGGRSDHILDELASRYRPVLEATARLAALARLRALAAELGVCEIVVQGDTSYETEATTYRKRR